MSPGAMPWEALRGQRVELPLPLEGQGKGDFKNFGTTKSCFKARRGYKTLSHSPLAFWQEQHLKPPSYTRE